MSGMSTSVPGSVTFSGTPCGGWRGWAAPTPPPGAEDGMRTGGRERLETLSPALAAGWVAAKKTQKSPKIHRVRMDESAPKSKGRWP